MAESKVILEFQGVNSVSPVAKKVAEAVKKVEQQTDKASEAAKKQASATTRLGGAYRSTRMAAQNFSFQIQDIAVQLTAGQNAALVFAQQFPQLASGFGVYGAAIGAVAAVMAGLSMAFSKSESEASTLAGKIDHLANRYNDLGEGIKNAQGTLGAFTTSSAAARDAFVQLAEALKKEETDKAISDAFGGSIFNDLKRTSERFRITGEDYKRLRTELGVTFKTGVEKSDFTNQVKKLSANFQIGSKAAIEFAGRMKAIKVDPTEQGLEDMINFLGSLSNASNKDALQRLILDLESIRQSLYNPDKARAQSLAREIERINKESDTTALGVYNRKLEELDLAVEKGGLSIKDYAQALKRLDKEYLEAANGPGFKKLLEKFDEALKAQDKAAEAERKRQEQLIKRGSSSVDKINLEVFALRTRLDLISSGVKEAEAEVIVQRQLALERFKASIAGIKDEKERSRLTAEFLGMLDRKLELEGKIADQREKEKEQNLVIQDRIKLAKRLFELTKETQALSNIPPATPMPRPRGIGNDGILDLTDPGGVAAGFNEQAESIKRARDPLYAYLKDMELLRKNVQEGTDTFNIMESEITKTFETAVSKLTPMQEEVKKLSLSIAEDLGSSLANVVTGAQSAEDAMKQFVARAIQDLIKLALKMDEINNKQIGVGGGGSGNIIGTIIKGIASFAGGSSGGLSDELAMSGEIPQRAKGGPVMGGRTYLVGEKGPELFTAPKSGHITPNSQIGGGTVVNQTFQISTGVAQTVRAELVGMLPLIQQQTVAAVSNQKTRGGARGSRL